MLTQTCDNCGGDDLRECYERGDVVCMECGGCSPEKILDLGIHFFPVNFKKFDFLMFFIGPEKYNHFGGKNHTRVSETDFYLSFSEQNTFIGNGRNLFQQMQNQLVPKTMSLSQSKMSKGFSVTKKFEYMLDLSGQVIDTVRNIIAEFQKSQVKQKKRTNGTTSDAFVVAVIYMAFEIHQKGKNFKEVCAMTEVNEKKVRKFIKIINQAIPEKVKIHSR